MTRQAPGHAPHREMPAPVSSWEQRRHNRTQKKKNFHFSYCPFTRASIQKSPATPTSSSFVKVFRPHFGDMRYDLESTAPKSVCNRSPSNSLVDVTPTQNSLSKTKRSALTKAVFSPWTYPNSSWVYTTFALGPVATVPSHTRSFKSAGGGEELPSQKRTALSSKGASSPTTAESKQLTISLGLPPVCSAVSLAQPTPLAGPLQTPGIS
mmetsp:Transcript_8012/g.12695  ORF Transcript_8012/g.12695 Transcript_8012/m.12695 type:complete len:209 (+) Transcript_8012:163-789(+)